MKRYARKRTGFRKRSGTAKAKRSYKRRITRSRGTAIIRNPLSQRSLMVPLQYPFAYTLVTTQTDTDQFIYSGSCYPNCMGVQPTGQTFEMPVGLSQYGGVYSKFRIHGSKFDATFTNLGEDKVRIGLLALPYSSSLNGSGLESGPGAAAWDAVAPGSPPGVVAAYGDLSNYLGSTYVDMMNEPFMKWRTIHESTNPRCQTRFTSSRLTKKMLNIKDLKDADYVINDLVSSDRNPDAFNGINTDARGFCWMVKIDALNPTQILVQGKITYYVELFERFIPRNPDWTPAGPTGAGP